MRLTFLEKLVLDKDNIGIGSIVLFDNGNMGFILNLKVSDNKGTYLIFHPIENIVCFVDFGQFPNFINLSETAYQVSEILPLDKSLEHYQNNKNLLANFMKANQDLHITKEENVGKLLTEKNIFKRALLQIQHLINRI